MQGLQYELKSVEKWLTLSPASALPSLEEVKAENERIRMALIDITYSELPVEKIDRHIRSYQQALYQLDESVKRIEDPERQRGIKDALIDLHDRLESSLVEYWSRDAHLPPYKLQRIRMDMLTGVGMMRAKLEGSKVSPEFIGLMLQPLVEFVASKEDVSYQRWYKIRGLAAELVKGIVPERFIPLNLQIDATDKAIDICLRYDLNIQEIFHYLQVRTLVKMGAYADIPGQVLYLKGLLAYIRQEEHNSPGRVPGSLRTMYAGWLEALIGEKERAAQRAAEAGLPEPGGDEPMIQTTLTSEQLGCIIRLFMDTGVFSNRTFTEVAAFMARFVGTKAKKGKTKRSEKNLNNNFFSFSEDASLEVDKIMDDMKAHNEALRQEIRMKKAIPKEGKKRSTRGRNNATGFRNS